MPKRIEVIKDWSGGQNDTTSSTKIKKNESVRLRKFVAKGNGVLGIGPMPKVLNDDFLVEHTYRPRPGQGLGSYLVDYDLLSNTDTFQPSPSTTEVPTEIITLQDGANVRLWDGGHWHHSGISVMNGQGTDDADHELYGGKFLLDQYDVDGKLHVNNANFDQYVKSHTEAETWGPPWGRMVWHNTIVSSVTGNPLIIYIWPAPGTLTGDATEYHYIGKWGFTAWIEDSSDPTFTGKHTFYKEIWEVTTNIDIGMTDAEASERIIDSFVRKINGKSYIFEASKNDTPGVNALRLLARDYSRPFCVQMSNIVPIEKIVYSGLSGYAGANFMDYDDMVREHDFTLDTEFNLTGLSSNPSTNANTWEGRHEIASVPDDVRITFPSPEAYGVMDDVVDDDGKPVAYAVPYTTIIDDGQLLSSNPSIHTNWLAQEEGTGSTPIVSQENGYILIKSTDIVSGESTGATYTSSIAITSGNTYTLHVSGVMPSTLTSTCHVRIQLSTVNITGGGGHSDTAISVSSGSPYIDFLTGDDEHTMIRSETFTANANDTAYLTISSIDGASGGADFYFYLYKIYLVEGDAPASHGGAEWPSIGLNTAKVLCHKDDFPAPQTDGYWNVGMRIQPHTMRTSLRYKKASYFSNNNIRVDGSPTPGPFPVEIDEWLTTDEIYPHSTDMFLLPPDPQHGLWFKNSVFNASHFAGKGNQSTNQWRSTVGVGYIFDTGMIGLSCETGSGDSSFTESRYYFGLSYYDDYGNSTEITNDPLIDYRDVTAGDVLNFEAVLRPFNMHATQTEYNYYGFDKRIAGAKWWMRKKGSHMDWRLVMDIDFEKGYRFAGWDDYYELNDYSSTAGGEVYNGILFTATTFGAGTMELFELPSVTFESHLDYIPTAQKRWRWKTSCIAGNRAYIGNVMPVPTHNDPLKNEFVSRVNTIDHTDGHSDLVLYSPLGKYDIFPESNYISVTVQDGDSIIALKGVGDEILQFKRNNLYITEVTETDVLTQEHKFLGIDSNAAVTSTMNGVAWCNKSGVYHYDGREVKSLTEGKVLEKWKRVFDTSYTGEPLVDRYPSIEYCERGNILLVFPMGTDGRFDNEQKNSGHLMIYEINRQAWYEYGAELGETEGVMVPSYISGFPYNSTFTNMINTDAGSVIRTIDDVAEGVGTWRTFALNDLPSEGMGACFYQSRDINFGESYLKKKVSRVVITLRSNMGWLAGNQDQNHTTLAVNYYTNEGGPFEFDVVSGGEIITNTFWDLRAVIGDFAGSAGEDATKWYQCILKPRTSSEANNIRIFKLSIQSFDPYEDMNQGVFESYKVDKTFEINDISITYKFKGSH